MSLAIYMKKFIDEKKICSSFPAGIDTVAMEKDNRVQKAWHTEKLEATIAELEKARLPKGAKNRLWAQVENKNTLINKNFIY